MSERMAAEELGQTFTELSELLWKRDDCRVGASSYPLVTTSFEETSNKESYKEEQKRKRCRQKKN